MFLDLRARLGDEAIWRGFLWLYPAVRDDTHEAECAGVERGACYVCVAFTSDDASALAGLAGSVIDPLVRHGLRERDGRSEGLRADRPSRWR
ncbi:MAG: hypothetical protein F4Z96_02505 [Chloroflexi bacterium]|nr:hypothetical protein [Chloroflexota bacterium]